MQESVSMHKSPIPVRHSRMNQARSDEEETERGRQEATSQFTSHKSTRTFTWSATIYFAGDET